MLCAMMCKQCEGGRILAARIRVVTAVAVAWGLLGCRVEPTMPGPIEIRPDGGSVITSYDVKRDRHPDYWRYQGPDGRIRSVAFGAASSPHEPGERVDLDAIRATGCPHFVIALDGVPFELVEQMYREGHFRLFHPPSRVIACFPSLTDLGLAELFHAGRCIANQALYYDRKANRLSDGNAVYLSGKNAPWVRKMTYRCSFWWDGLSYLDPQTVFDHEMIGIVDAFRRVRTGEAYTYSIGSAGLGIRWGRPGFIDFLLTVDRLCEQIVYENRGRAKITLTSDHGHGLVECTPISFEKVLTAGGYRLRNSIRDPKDVVAVAYGLCTYAELSTKDPTGVAGCLLNHPGVDLVTYAAGDCVIVRDRNGEARVRKGAAGFVYEAQRGDPLKLAGILERLRRDGKVTASGEADPQALFAATVDHDYPDPLRRVWEAFHDIVDNPPDLIVSLRDDACYGSRFFYAMIGKVGSTHGSLNRRNSTTVAMTMLGDLPPVMRARDVMPELEKLRTSR